MVLVAVAVTMTSAVLVRRLVRPLDSLIDRLPVEALIIEVPLHAVAEHLKRLPDLLLQNSSF